MTLAKPTVWLIPDVCLCFATKNTYQKELPLETNNKQNHEN